MVKRNWKDIKQLTVTTKALAIVTLDGLDINDVIKQAADLAHEVLEELSIEITYKDSIPVDSVVVFKE